MASRLALVVALIVSTGVSRAAPLAFQFSGTVIQVPIDDLYGDIVTGGLISGSFTFDSATADLIPGDPAIGSYTSSGAPFGMSVTIGSHVFSAQDSLNIGVFNAFVDQYTVLALGAGGSLTLELFLQDDSGTVFSGDGLPLALAPLPSFTVRDFHLHEIAAGGEFQADGQLTSITSAAPVPEPAAAILVLTGVGLLSVVTKLRREK